MTARLYGQELNTFIVLEESAFFSPANIETILSAKRCSGIESDMRCTGNKRLDNRSASMG
jgi:hypothetical protein